MSNCKICISELVPYIENLYDNRHGYFGKFDLLRCNECGFIQMEPQLSLNELSYLYTKYYPKRDFDISEISTAGERIPDKKTINNQGLSTACHYMTQPGQDVLDIGCGDCRSLIEINNLGGNAYGIEVDKNSQKVANKLKLNFHLGTIHDYNTKKKFDLITASQVLEHEPDPIGFLKSSKKNLKNYGRIILSFPNTDAFYKKLWGKNWLHWHVPYHLNHFNKKSFKLLANLAGLEIVSMKTVTPNLWTILQLRSYIYKPGEGNRDTMWDPNPASYAAANSSRNRNIVSGLVKIAPNFLFFNRLFDSFGYGESFVVILKSD